MRRPLVGEPTERPSDNEHGTTHGQGSKRPARTGGRRARGWGLASLQAHRPVGQGCIPGRAAGKEPHTVPKAIHSGLAPPDQGLGSP